MNLLAITASQNVGHIDWEPYIPMIFTRLLRSLDLPVCYKSMKSARNQTLWSSSVASKCTQGQNDFFPKDTWHLLKAPFISFPHSLDCISSESEKFSTALFVKIPGCRRILLASSQQWQMGWRYQWSCSSATEIPFRSFSLRALQTSSVETSSTRGTSTYRKLFDTIRGIIQADRSASYVLTHECYRYRQNFQAFSRFTARTYHSWCYRSSLCDTWFANRTT